MDGVSARISNSASGGLPETCDVQYRENPALMHWNARKYPACVEKNGKCNVVYQHDLQIHWDTNVDSVRVIKQARQPGDQACPMHYQEGRAVAALSGSRFAHRYSTQRDATAIYINAKTALAQPCWRQHETLDRDAGLFSRWHKL
jgi:hypothetical protein